MFAGLRLAKASRVCVGNPIHDNFAISIRVHSYIDTHTHTHTTNHKFNFPLWFVLSPPCCSHAAPGVCMCSFTLLKFVIVVHSFDALVRSFIRLLCICAKFIVCHRISTLSLFSLVLFFATLFFAISICISFFCVCISLYALHFSMYISRLHVCFSCSICIGSNERVTVNAIYLNALYVSVCFFCWHLSVYVCAFI